MSRRALISGISGQDGAYLAQLLLSKGYEVWGTSRNIHKNEFYGLKALGILERVKLRSMSPESFHSVLDVFSDLKPHEVYNLSGQSSVGLSFEQPIETSNSIATATLNQLEAIRILDKSIRFYNAGSSEMFGDIGDKAADENTPFNPRSPYAVAKVTAMQQVSLYRDAFGLFACTGILFNHESPLRPDRFVTKKIVSAAYRIANGSKEKLNLGNVDIYRDWGWAPDYVDSMYRMLAKSNPEDFVIATGVTQSLKDFIITVFDEADLVWSSYVSFAPELRRPTDISFCAANPTKAEKLLSWRASCRGPEIARRMYRAMGSN